MVKIVDLRQQLIACGKRFGGLYELTWTNSSSYALHTAVTSSSKWHERLGHPSNKRMIKLPSQVLGLPKLSNSEFCS